MAIELTTAGPPLTEAALKYWQQVSAECGVSIDGLSFMYDAFTFTQQSVANEIGETAIAGRHCTAAQYCDSFIRFAKDKFGEDYVAALSSYGLDTSEKLGQALYLLISRNLFGKQESDLQSDFDDQFNLASDNSKSANWPVCPYSLEHLPPLSFARRSFLRSRLFRIVVVVLFSVAIIEIAAAIADYIGRPELFFLIVIAMIWTAVLVRPLLPYFYRFSLRALLIAMTLVALALGLVVVLFK
jgi:uncharacterized repeat protein (TIGR04138 family)